MSIQLLERPDIDARLETKLEEGADYDHVVCHCDLTKAWCGEEVKGGLDTDKVGADCPECEALCLEYEERCPNGCDCSASERYWYCGVDDMSDDEEDDEDE